MRRARCRPCSLPGTTLSPHPSLSAGQGGGIAGLYAAGKIGLLPGIDYANPDLSHFHSRAFWETGTITPQPDHGLARTLAGPVRQLEQPVPGPLRRVRASRRRC